jgi:hypothetical protein
MKRLSTSILAVLLGLTLTGCGAAAKTIALKSQSERTDIFTEVSGTETIPTGYADLTITSNIKTHPEGYYIGESKESAHGKAAYPFLINIDGQAVLWRVAGDKHQLPKYVDGKTSRNPEAGEGMKYVLDKKVRLAVGAHRVFFGLPEEPYYTVADISVQGGKAYVLEFKPVYQCKTLPTRIPTYLKGIHKYDIVVNEIVDR